MNIQLLDKKVTRQIVNIPINGIKLGGELVIPPKAKGIVIFAHGSGSSRLSPRNRYVAEVLQKKNIATLLVDLLSIHEESNYENRFDIDLLCERLSIITDWVSHNTSTYMLGIGYFGASTGAPAVMQTVLESQDSVKAIVSRGGRVDLTQELASRIHIPTLLIVGEKDYGVKNVNEAFFDKLSGEKSLDVITNATHLFEESGCLEMVAKDAAKWFSKYLTKK